MQTKRFIWLAAVLLTASLAFGFSSQTASGVFFASVSGDGVWVQENTAPTWFSREDVIDQNQPNGPVYMAAFSQGDLAQSFQQTNANISGAGILLQPGIGSSDNVTIQLWDALPNQSGTMLAQASATGTQGQWVDVFWTAVTITPATTYYLVFTGNTSLGIAGDTGNPYPHGNVFANPGYNSFPNYDYAFRTYYDDDVSLERHTWAGVKSLFE